MQFKIPVAAGNVRSIKNPQPEASESQSKVRIVHAYVSVGDLPHDIPLDPDPRTPKSAGEVPKRIKASLLSNDGKFHLKNRGITISVKHCEIDNKRNLLTLTIPEGEEQWGILDGAHTYSCISEGVAEERKKLGLDDSAEHDEILPAQFVHLEVLERIENDLADIAEARNFSVPLKAWTLASYRDKFDWLLKALGKDYSGKIRVSENDSEPVGILDIVQIISAVNPCLFPAEKPAVEAYKNVGKMLKAFIDEKDPYRFRDLSPVCKDVIRLYDHVRYHFKGKYNAPDESGKRGKFGRTKEAQEAKEKRGSRSRATYHFLRSGANPVEGEEPIDKGLSIPLISGFRVLLEQKQGVWTWQTDPFSFFDNYGSKLIRSLMEASDANDGDPHVVGRDGLVYQRLTSEVRRWYLESKFERRTTLL